MAGSAPDLKTTPLHALHQDAGARMVPFAGYAMPVQYPTGILKEHEATRNDAGLFDVSHMGQVRVTATGMAPAVALERLVPGDIQGLDDGAMRYTLLTTDSGGIRDDLMVTRLGEALFLVVNAATKDDDIAHLRAGLDGLCAVEPLTDRALLALQGPRSEAIVATLAPDAAALTFMQACQAQWNGTDLLITRSGYTGEDGFEISLPADRAEALARMLIEDGGAVPVGLGARDSLRLEAGLCLFGHEITTQTNPVEAGLTWAIAKRRRTEGGFPGAAQILRTLAEGPRRRRIGLTIDGKAPVREGAEIQTSDGQTVGVVTSGGFAPTVGRPIAMAYVDAEMARSDVPLQAVLRGRTIPVTRSAMPFVPNRYKR